MMSADYYDLAKTAEVLSVPAAEVNRLREQNKLRGFRDGSNWRFRKEDVHSYLAESIKSRSSQKPGDSDFELDSSPPASSSSFDLLMEEAPLPGESQMISAGASQATASDVDLASLEYDDLALAEETRVSAVVIAKKQPEKAVSESDFDLGQEESDALALAPVNNTPAVELDDEPVLAVADDQPEQDSKPGESGFDLAADQNDDLLAAIQAESKPVSAAPFDLKPNRQPSAADDSESSSQVIAVEGITWEEPAANKDSDDFPFGDDFSGGSAGFGSGVQHAAPADGAFGSFDTGGFGGEPNSITSPKPSPPLNKTEEYSTGMLTALACAAVLLVLPGCMLVDLIAYLWSWGEPFVLNSILMDTIGGWFGLLS